MKKLLIFALVAVILAASLVLPVSAADADYDEDELKQLLTDAFEIYVEFARNFDDAEPDSTVQLYSPEELLRGTEVYTYFARRIGEYRMFADFESALEACVTSDIKDDFIKYEHILNIDGYTYSCILAGMHQNQGIWFEPTDMGLKISSISILTARSMLFLRQTIKSPRNFCCTFSVVKIKFRNTQLNTQKRTQAGVSAEDHSPTI